MLEGKTALITGSTSGIGLGIAKSLAEQGARVVLNGLATDADAERLKAEFHDSYGIKAGFSGADLTDPDAIEGLMGYVARDFGGADILVNNAGVQHVSPIEDFPVDRWDLIIALNLSATFHTTRMAISGMKELRYQKILLRRPPLKFNFLRESYYVSLPYV